MNELHIEYTFLSLSGSVLHMLDIVMTLIFYTLCRPPTPVITIFRDCPRKTTVQGFEVASDNVQSLWPVHYSQEKAL